MTALFAGADTSLENVSPCRILPVYSEIAFSFPGLKIKSHMDLFVILVSSVIIRLSRVRNGKPIDFIMLSQIYGDGNPKDQWTDDIETWDGLSQ